jgi:hypothetical protein
MRVAGVTVVKRMRVTRMTVVMRMGMSGHPHHSTRSTKGLQPFPELIRQYDTQSLVID